MKVLVRYYTVIHIVKCQNRDMKEIEMWIVGDGARPQTQPRPVGRVRSREGAYALDIGIVVRKPDTTFFRRLVSCCKSALSSVRNGRNFMEPGSFVPPRCCVRRRA